MKFNPIHLAVTACIAPASHLCFAQHDDSHIEEITIVSSPIAKKVSDSSLSVSVMEGESLRESIAATLGESINGQLGVQGASFGAGASAPVIRGQSGSRVRVLQDGAGLGDAASISPDHANAVEPMLAKRIEVIRGPSTLLYGNGAIGGVVNVIDKRIPTELEQTLLLEQRHDTNNNGNTTVFSGNSYLGSVAMHLDASKAVADDTHIPGYALLEEQHEEGEDEHEDDAEENYGRLENSDYENSQFSFGTSHISATGFIGASLTYQEKNYGLPAGSHEHDEEQAADQADEEQESENVRIDMEKTRFVLKTKYEFDSFWRSVDAQLAVTDYQHQEIEGDELGTLFENDTVEMRANLHHASSDALSGVIGTQLLHSEFSALGDEAFIPATDNQNLALYTIQNYDRENVVYEFGLRVEQQDYSNNQCKRDFFTHSASASGLWRMNQGNNMVTTFTHSERAPSTDELFSNLSATQCQTQSEESLWVLHAPTARIELGNPDLKTETSNNVELSWRKYETPVQLEVNTYINEIDRYTYLADLDHDETQESTEVIDAHEEEQLAEYIQDDAKFWGLEAKAFTSFELNSLGHIDIEVFGDTVKAKFKNGARLPRIPAARLGTSLGYNANSLSVKLNATHTYEQSELAQNEVQTDGYTRLSLYADYHLELGNSEWTMFAKGDNLLDEDIRNNASFTKEFAPEKGRGFTLGVRISL